MKYRFGAFVLDEKLFELRKEGKLVPIQPKAFDILACLLRNGAAVVSRAELGAKVWPGVAVTGDSLGQAIMAARAAIGDDSDDPAFIQTVRGRGYRFVGAVESAEGLGAREPTPPTTPRAEPSLVGRAESLATLLALLERARGGRGGVCLVTGDSGIGKTRLVEEVAAAPAGFEALLLHCYEGEGAPDLWPFAQALQRLRGVGATFAGDVAALAEGRVAPSTFADPKRCFALLDGVVGALAASAALRPLLVVVDDLHHADMLTVRLIALLATQIRSVPLLFVGIYAPTPPPRVPTFSAAMGALSQESSTSTVRVGPLGRDDVGLFMQQATGRPASEALVTKALEKTGGNPHLLTQLVSVLGALTVGARPSAGATSDRSDHGTMATSALVGAEGVRNAITSMLAQLPESSNRVLTLAAVFGASFPVAAVASALEVPNDVVLRELDTAGVARVVARVDASRYRFVYPLVRDLLYKRLSALDHWRLHRCAAIALERQLGDAQDHVRVAEVAAHLVEAAAAGDVNAAADCSLRAASLAQAAGDHGAAETYARRGLAAFRFAQVPDETRRKLLGAFLRSTREGGP